MIVHDHAFRFKALLLPIGSFVATERCNGGFAHNAADTDEAGHAFQSEAGRPFRFEAGRGSDLMSATWLCIPTGHVG